MLIITPGWLRSLAGAKFTSPEKSLWLCEGLLNDYSRSVNVALEMLNNISVCTNHYKPRQRQQVEEKSLVV